MLDAGKWSVEVRSQERGLQPASPMTVPVIFVEGLVVRWLKRRERRAPGTIDGTGQNWLKSRENGLKNSGERLREPAGSRRESAGRFRESGQTAVENGKGHFQSAVFAFAGAV
jgi:hypothetical protein